MTTTIRSSADGSKSYIAVGGTDRLCLGADNSGHLAGFRNILINGDMRINQREVAIAAAANGAYGPDRWKKVDASNMTQIVESGNYKPSATYTLSGTGVTTQQITSPASGNWTLPNIPIAATKVQLEEGSIATPFEQRPIGLELSLCQRYYEIGYAAYSHGTSSTEPAWPKTQYTTFKVTKRTTATVAASSWIREASGANIAVVSQGITMVSNNGFRFHDLDSVQDHFHLYWTASAEL